MKRYVFFTNSIRNMGGAQMYIRNKALFLKQHGWTPSVYFYTEGKILIPELQEFAGNRIPDLAYPVTAVGKRKRERILKRICTDLAGAEECVIESSIYPNCYWMEEIAKRVKGRNILYILHEGFPQCNEQEISYLKYKLERRELFNGIEGIKMRIGKIWENDNVFLMPSYSNVTAPVDYPLEYDRSHKTILSIGRLDKPYIKPMLEEINIFTKNHKVEVNLILVGGAAEESYINNIKEYLSEKSQIKPYFLGYMFPVPESIVRASDVAIASSGSILVPAEMGVPTIAIDIQDYMAMGVYGCTTSNTFKRQAEPQLKTADLLEEVLIEGKYTDIEVKPSRATIDAEKILLDHLKKIEALDAPKEYFDVFTIYSRKEIIQQKTIMAIYKIFGESGVEKLVQLKNKILNNN